MVAVRVMVWLPWLLVGRLTAPVVVLIQPAGDALQVMVVPLAPADTKFRLLVMLFSVLFVPLMLFQVKAAKSKAMASSEVCSAAAALIVRVKSLAALVEPFLMVAVKVTVWLP
jgi:hypothetical protein